jgi:phosphatidate phosphatase APP1
VKVTDVLNIRKTLEATFLHDPVPIPGMPAVYASLQRTLSNPSFFYISGSPSQLYPFLHTFIQSNYPGGPIMLQNVTLTDIQELKNIASPDGIEEYKSAMIGRIQGIYPGRSFLLIGDSTQKDPETYGSACVESFSPLRLSLMGTLQIQAVWTRVHKVYMDSTV